MSKTEENLRTAFAGESQTNRRYLAFSAKADQEGYPQVARLFRAAAEAETFHAHNYLKALQGILSTRENLEQAISVESHAFQNLYPRMMETAREEGSMEAERLFQHALEAEKAHARLFQALLDALGGAQEEYPYYVCTSCGFTVERKLSSSCRVCGAGDQGFKRVD